MGSFFSFLIVYIAFRAAAYIVPLETVATKKNVKYFGDLKVKVDK